MMVHAVLRSRRLVIAAAAALAAGCASWPPGGVTVTGRDNPDLDVAAVQQAVDQGGTVRLKGVFDFGEKGNVRITRDVAIAGERDAAGQPATLVKRGLATFRSLPPETIASPGPKVAIRDIHFDGATWMPMQLAYISGATVERTKVTHVRPAPFPPSQLISQGKPFNMQHAVVIGGATLEPGVGRPYQPGRATGRVKIAGNTFDLACDAMTTTVAQAVFIIWTTGIDADVAGNTIRNVARNAIEVIDNFRGPDGSGRIVLRDNDIETPAQGTPMPTPRTPNGIVLGYFLDMKAAADSSRTIAHAVLKNRVLMRGQTPGASAVATLGNDAEVAGNQIVLAGGPGIVGISVMGSGNRVVGNRVEGAGAAGVAVVPMGPLPASRNEVIDNDVLQLKASPGHVVLAKGSSDNRVSGASGSIVDAGERNVWKGLKPVAPAGP